jgi:indoleamine 2,3-dioxygenase
MYINNIDEHNFQMMHVAIICRTHQMMAAMDVLKDGLKNKDRETFNEGMKKLGDFLEDSDRIFNKMWETSAPKNYLSYRTFIMGIEGNTAIFPNGVVYEGCYDNKPQYFRGETGAQDSMIPCVDSILDIKYPKNQLTKYLWELRDYRPAEHQNLIEGCRSFSEDHGLREFCMKDSNSMALYLRALHHTFIFRHSHWKMVKKYIIANIKYPMATGGTPITTWLPNQMGACLERCQDMFEKINPGELEGDIYDDYMMRHQVIKEQIENLFREVNELQTEFDS